MIIDKRYLMIGFLFFIAMATFPAPAYAETINYCLNDTYSQQNNTIGVGINGNSSTVLDLDKMIYCNNGCSSTLGECRMDNLWESIAIIAIIGFIILVIIYTHEFRTMSLAIVAIACISSVLIGVTDIFSSPLNTLFLILPLGIIGEYIVVAIDKSREKDYD